ncbi:MAG: DNA-binding IclR family transcriptional regulator [Limimaricola cinnabarinus]|uniref:IclR family transcriptional regulator n=1 Tax=Limimaricola cinnabarinus TaxID=1125964 RepID=UPI0039E66CF8
MPKTCGAPEHGGQEEIVLGEARRAEVHIVEGQGSGGAQSVDRALGLLRLVGRQPEEGVPLSALVAMSGLNKPTVRRLMLALIRAGMIEQETGRRRYRLGQESYVLGTLAAVRHGLAEMAGDALADLARDSGDTAFLSVRRGDAAVCLQREEGAYPIRTHALMPGARHPLGVGAGSLAMLAALPPGEAEAVLEANREVLARDYPALPPERLRELAARAREAGYALNPGLVFPDSWGIGVALRRPDGGVAGAVSIAAVAGRMQPPRSEAFAPLLTAAAARIEARLARAYATAPQSEGSGQ